VIITLFFINGFVPTVLSETVIVSRFLVREWDIITVITHLEKCTSMLSEILEIINWRVAIFSKGHGQDNVTLINGWL
jgi:hypothetical protein